MPKQEKIHVVGAKVTFRDSKGESTILLDGPVSRDSIKAIAGRVKKALLQESRKA